MAAVTPSSFLLDHIDDASANLILQLQLDDLKDLKLKRSGKQREDSQNDGEVAAELLEENIDNLLTFLGDRRMTRSIAQAVQADGVILARTALEEEVSHEDHALAQRLNGSTVNWEANVRSESIDDAVLSKLAGLYVSEELGQKLATGDLQLDEEEADEHPETSAWAASRQNAHKPNAVNHHCEACQEQKKYFDVVAAPCGHEYCRDCLRDLFSASFTDESLFPPRCCRQSISLKTVSIFLTSRLKEEYERKKIEFSTPNRTYCSRPLCSSFIPAENINDEIASCPSCAARTCAICKAESHAGQDCPNDTALLETLNLAQENGWQRCYSCRRLVELDIGCNHMTFVSYHPLLKLLLTLEGALVVRNFATYVENGGRPAHAHSGTKIAS